METREAIKNEVDKLPENVLDEVYRYLHSLKDEKPKKKILRTYQLQGQFDNIDIRKQAYE